MKVAAANPSRNTKRLTERLQQHRYEPLDFFILRAPVLSLDSYRDLRPGLEDLAEQCTLLASDDQISRALAVSSLTLLDALRHRSGNHSRRSKVYQRLLRYLIRMSTRPTPFGLLAGVAIGRWSDGTELELSSGPRPQRSRPDMAWLMNLVVRLESDPAVRRKLIFTANSSALIRAGRVFLAERVSRNEANTRPMVSIRATGVVRRALQAARDPISYEALESHLLATTPGATKEKVETLLTELWQQTLLLSDLRPPLTVSNPARYLLDRLSGIPAAASTRKDLEAILDAAAAWDAAHEENTAQHYGAMAKKAAAIVPSNRSFLQVDSLVTLTRDKIARRVGEESVRAAELLLRISPLPRGPAYLEAYRRAFERRYGQQREVPLLELLDRDFGLGPPDGYSSSPVGASATRSSTRNQTLMGLALTALRERLTRVELSEDTLRRLETRETAPLPPSLEIFASIAAASPQAVDTGDFLLVVGPNVGSSSAGRSLGRFADLQDVARIALESAARAEEAHFPEKLWAELVYQPRLFRQANVSIRPNIRANEIALGVGRSSGQQQIPPDELVVGIRGNRFYIRWPKVEREIIVTRGHMLNYSRAPAVGRFLSELTHDGCCQLSGFNWGPAATFPFLPRIQVGRIVLGLAQWRLGREFADRLCAKDGEDFLQALNQWREDWQVPRHVYLCSGDNRLLIDLLAPVQSDELHRALLALRGDGAILLTEVLPGLDHAWVRNSKSQPFMTELVIPLTLARSEPESIEPTRDIERHASQTLAVPHVASSSTRMRAPGSDWLFAKLYCSQTFEDDLIAGPIRDIAERALASEMAKDWFFLRYGDPENHIRLRFRGDPRRLLEDLLPVICGLMSELVESGICRRFQLDTYEREIERFGGDAGMSVAEDVFASDSRVIADLLVLLQSKSTELDRTTLAVLSVDALLDGLGLDPESRARWCWMQVQSRRETSREYRERKSLLRALLASADRKDLRNKDEAIAETLDRLRTSIAKVNRRYVDLETAGALSRPLHDIRQSLVHLHLNRLLGADHRVERLILGLLWRAREALLRAPAS